MQIPLSVALPRVFVPALRALALPLLFLMFGVVIGTWAGRIPALREAAQLSHSVLSLVLLCGGLGAFVSFPLSSWLMTTLGARKTVLFAGVVLLLDLVCIGLASSPSLLMLAVFMLGVSASCFDVAVNAAATALEKASGRSLLSTLHAWGCAGALAGAALGSAMAGLGIGPAAHFMVVALPLGALLWFGFELLASPRPAERSTRKEFRLPRGPLAWLGALGFLAAMSEGSVADWSGVFLKEHFRAGDALAPLAFSAFSVTMLAMRLVGDRLKELYGARGLIGLGACVSAGGLFFAVLAPNAWLALAGFAAAGLGLAIVFPFVFSAAGKEGPIALAGVATMAYSGSLLGPPIIGALAHTFGMQAAIGFVGLLSVMIAIVASRSALLN